MTKRLVLFALVISILFSFPARALADGVNWSSMTVQEIYSEIDNAKQELIKRNIQRTIDDEELLIINPNFLDGLSNDATILHYDLSDCHIALISETSLWESDDDDRVAAAITFTWTNNSDETSNAFSALVVNAYQDGIQLDMTFTNGQRDEYMRNIRPGASLQVQYLFILRNTESSVEVEVRNFMDIFRNQVAYHVFDLQ